MRGFGAARCMAHVSCRPGRRSQDAQLCTSPGDKSGPMPSAPVPAPVGGRCCAWPHSCNQPTGANLPEAQSCMYSLTDRHPPMGTSLLRGQGQKPALSMQFGVGLQTRSEYEQAL